MTYGKLLLPTTYILSSTFFGLIDYSITFSPFFTVVPQPVYMNMNDLKVLAAQKAEMSAVEFQNLPPDQEQEDSPELKTPTAESNGIMVPEVQKAGSGLPYSNTAAITHSHIVSPKSEKKELLKTVHQSPVPLLLLLTPVIILALFFLFFSRTLIPVIQ